MVNPPKSRLKNKVELDQKLAPNIKSFMQRKVITKDESMPSARARAVPGENRDVPTSLVYTCTQPHNGGGKPHGS